MKNERESSQQSQISDHAVSRFVCFYSFFFLVVVFHWGFIITYCLSYNFKKASGYDSKFNNPIFVRRFPLTPIGLYFFPVSLS